MFGWFKKVVAWLDGPRIRDTYEDMLLQEAAEKKAVQEPLVLDTPVEEVAPAAAIVETQITDAVTAPAPEVVPAKPKRARTTKGRLKADDKSTPDVNEAWEGGKAPAKKPAAPKKPRAKKTSK